MMITKMHNLTEHFTLEELTYSYTAKQYNIDNRPNKFQISELTRLCKNILEPIRQKTGKPIIISSGYRCKELNDRIGGVKNSLHCDGDAVDIKIKPSNSELMKIIPQMISNNEIELRTCIFEKCNKSKTDCVWVHLDINNKTHSYRKNKILYN